MSTWRDARLRAALTSALSRWTARSTIASASSRYLIARSGTPRPAQARPTRSRPPARSIRASSSFGSRFDRSSKRWSAAANTSSAWTHAPISPSVSPTRACVAGGIRRTSGGAAPSVQNGSATDATSRVERQGLFVVPRSALEITDARQRREEGDTIFPCRRSALVQLTRQRQVLLVVLARAPLVAEVWEIRVAQRVADTQMRGGQVPLHLWLTRHQGLELLVQPQPAPVLVQRTPPVAGCAVEASQLDHRHAQGMAFLHGCAGSPRFETYNPA